MGITLLTFDRIRTLILFLLFAVVTTLKAQEADYYKPDYFRYDNYIYKKSIKTVILEPAMEPLSPPVIRLKSTEKLHLKFDDLSEDAGNYSYKYIHCSSNWQQSNISETEYLDGFFTDQIATWRHSLSTWIPYFHYELEFPTSLMQIKISGNYLLVVFETSDPDKIVFTRRFFVTESNAEVNTRIHQATIIDQRFSHQEVDFQISTTLPLRNPYKDLSVTIVQNNRWDIPNSTLKPLFVNDDKLEYDLEDDNVFPGTNEFRFADLRTMQFETASMEYMTRDSLTMAPMVVLKKDQRRATERYSVLDDINGYYLIKIYDNRDGDTEAEYVKTRFRLPVSAAFDSSEVFVFGQLNNWNLDSLNRMRYNETEHCYVLDILLKQGYYNYQYLVRPLGKSAGSSETEGDRFETRNEYAFYVYWSDPLVRYDRLVGFKLAK